MASNEAQERERRIKKLLFQSRHRGTREADFLLGGFAERHLTELSDAELGAFERLLGEPDPDIVDWVLDRVCAPTPHQTRVLDLIKKFKNER
jgi:antitoxin CptB